MNVAVKMMIFMMMKAHLCLVTSQQPAWGGEYRPRTDHLLLWPGLLPAPTDDVNGDDEGGDGDDEGGDCNYLNLLGSAGVHSEFLQASVKGIDDMYNYT